MKKRVIRRHHYYRLKKKVRWYYGGFWDTEGNNKAHDSSACGLIANTATRCSCVMCGNPRRHYKSITKQEYFNLLSYIEQCEEEGVFTRERIKRFK